jgi:tetratricopeptide (TPR) repeat protein
MKLRFSIRFFIIIYLSILAAEAWAGPVEDANKLLGEQAFEAALKVVEDGLKADRNNENLLALKGYSLTKLGRYKEAIKFYKRMIRRAPKDAQWMANLITVYRWQGDTDKAIETAELMIRTFSQNPRGYEMLGDIYLQFARDYYQQGVKTAGEKNPSLNRKLYVSSNFNQIAQNLVAVNQQPVKRSSETIAPK